MPIVKADLVYYDAGDELENWNLFLNDVLRFPYFCSKVRLNMKTTGNQF